MIAYNFNWAVIWRNWDAFLSALAFGLGLAVVSLLIGTIIGLGLAYARLSPRRWLSWPAWLYVELIRNTPLLLLIFFVYFGLPELGIYIFDKIESFIITLSAYAAAYMCEVFAPGSPRCRGPMARLPRRSGSGHGSASAMSSCP
jgi:polar amino acid transport system permease protein